MSGEKSSVRQFLVKVEGIDEYFTTFEGGNVGAQATKVYDGGNPQPSVITSQAEADDVTVTRTYSFDRDADIIASLKQQVGSFTTTLSKTPTDRNLVALGKASIYSNAVLTGVQEPPADAGGTDPATWGLVFSVPNWT